MQWNSVVIFMGMCAVICGVSFLDFLVDDDCRHTHLGLMHAASDSS